MSVSGEACVNRVENCIAALIRERMSGPRH